MSDSRGKVFWITGLSAVGKSTIGKLLVEKLKQRSVPVIFLDGDDLRKVYGYENNHFSAVERKEIAMKNARLCQYLSDQGVNIVCATISLFNVVHEWNRKNINEYVEILIESPIDTLKKRDPKKIYSRASNGELQNVAGLDLIVEIPSNPDLIIHNSNSTNPQDHADEIFNLHCKVIETQ